MTSPRTTLWRLRCGSRCCDVPAQFVGLRLYHVGFSAGPVRHQVTGLGGAGPPGLALGTFAVTVRGASRPVGRVAATENSGLEECLFVKSLIPFAPIPVATRSDLPIVPLFLLPHADL